jgi:alpha-1,6-mannosyltransferase
MIIQSVRRSWSHILDDSRFWIVGVGILSLAVYLGALNYGAFRPDRIEPFFPMFGTAFLLYAVGCQTILALHASSKQILILTFVMAALFNLILLPSAPTLSDDMYRYIWDGRVQASGINPYRYPSNAAELAGLRDSAIWKHMNRIDAVTVYPPGAEAVFALLWRVFPDRIVAFKLAMVLAALIAGWLLTRLLIALGERPERVIIFLWSPLLVFEVAHAGHVDALFLPLIVGAMLVRAIAPTDRVSTRHEALIGLLLGAATLVKLYPAILLVPLWSVRDNGQVRTLRLALPITMAATIAAGYVLYSAPGIDTLGFLRTYSHEFFNIAPIPAAMIQWAVQNHIAFYVPVNVVMPVLVALVSVWFLIFPARSAREAILRCAWPIGIYLVISQNLFSWYVLGMLPLISISLQPGRWLGWTLNPAFAWWLFSGLVILSYTLFITGYAQDWAAYVQFLPLYALVSLPALVRIRSFRFAKARL